MIAVTSQAMADLARAYDTRPDQLTHFAGGREDSDGIIFSYPFRDRRRLLKVMAWPAGSARRARLCLEERLRFMRYLGEHAAPIVYPEASPGGRLFETCEVDAYLWVGYCMELVPGSPPPHGEHGRDFVRSWGQIIGLLHRLATEYSSWESSIDPETGERFLTWREEWEGFDRQCRDAEIRARWAELDRKLGGYPVDRTAFGFVHNDPHIANLLVEGPHLTLLDFDVANHHWFANDIAIACQGLLFGPAGGMERPLSDARGLRTFLADFMAGYRREYDLAAEWLDRLDTFLAYRRILLFLAMQDWIASRPDVQASWKNMILAQPELVGRRQS